MAVNVNGPAAPAGSPAEHPMLCEACGARFPERSSECPTCGMPVRREPALHASWRERLLGSRSLFVAEDVEDEVRGLLYGERSGCVRLRVLS